jgi:hypothetical protein
MGLVSSMARGADWIEDCDLLRGARTGEVLGRRVVASSTLDPFLRSFTSGMLACSTASGARRCGEPARREGGWSSTSTRSPTRSSVARSRAPRSATPASAPTTRSWPSAPTRASASATSSSPRRRDRAKLLRADRGCGSTTPSSGLSALAGSSRCPRGDRANRRARGRPRYPPTSITQMAETTLGGRRLVVRPAAPRHRRARAQPAALDPRARASPPDRPHPRRSLRRRLLALRDRLTPP